MRARVQSWSVGNVENPILGSSAHNSSKTKISRMPRTIEWDVGVRFGAQEFCGLRTPKCSSQTDLMKRPSLRKAVVWNAVQPEIVVDEVSYVDDAVISCFGDASSTCASRPLGSSYHG